MNFLGFAGQSFWLRAITVLDLLRVTCDDMLHLCVTTHVQQDACATMQLDLTQLTIAPSTAHRFGERIPLQ